MSVNMSESSAEEERPLLNPLLRDFAVPEFPEISPIIREDDDAITIRRPLQYHSIAPQPETQSHGDDTRAALNRYRYYNRLDPHRDSILMMPHHVVPSEYFLILPFRQTAGNQSSIITIFSIWNTMVGTSILTMPWALERAGFGCGIGLMILMAGITLYTAYRVMKSAVGTGLDTGPTSTVEFSDICRYYLGRWGEYLSVVFSLITLLGAAIVYWVLMTNFMYNSVVFIHDKVYHEFNSSVAPSFGNWSDTDVYCLHPPAHIGYPGPEPTRDARFWSTLGLRNAADKPLVGNLYSAPSNHSDHKGSVFREVWSQTNTVPLFLIAVLFPLINFKSPTFFTKFNALGTVSIMYILTLVAYKGVEWGINVDFDTKSLFYIPEFQWTFPALTGTLSLAMFIHNCVLSIVRNQKHPENNGRDLSIAYVCVACTYIFVGVVFYICFPLPKSCIEANLLDNFHNSDVLAFTARIFLFFQMVTVFPLLTYIFRIQVMGVIYNNIYPSLLRVLLLNAALVAIAVVFAAFYPHIGDIIRFSGALCGLVYIFTLPCLVYLMSLRASGALTWPVILIHSVVIVLGVLNFVSQFLILNVK